MKYVVEVDPGAMMSMRTKFHIDWLRRGIQKLLGGGVGGVLLSSKLRGRMRARSGGSGWGIM
jgi:hypothetical protein